MIFIQERLSPINKKVLRFREMLQLKSPSPVLSLIIPRELTLIFLLILLL